jgi:hypothetical protein
MKDLKKLVGDNGMSITFVLLFLCCLAGQALTGQRLENGIRGVHGQALLSLGEYVASGSFLQGVFSNWQAAILQLGTLILFGTYLRQKGAPHSKKEGREGTRHTQAPKQDDGAEKEGRPAEPGTGQTTDRSWFQRNSLSATFFCLFAVVFVLHFFSGLKAYDEQQADAHQPLLSAMQFAGSAKFWFLTLQTWEAEFMAVALYVVLSVYLRQEGSPESKPVEASDDETDVANE